MDLRRPADRAERIEILDRARWLTDLERTILEAYFREGDTASDIAGRVGLAPQAVRRRIRNALGRMTSPEFLYVLRTHRRWPDLRREIARRHVLWGQGLRTVASDLGVTIHVVRQHRDRIRTLFEATRG